MKLKSGEWINGAENYVKIQRIGPNIEKALFMVSRVT